MTLGDVIRNYRTQQRLSQRQFAISCQLSNGYISMLEKNLNPSTKLPVTPSLPILRKIAAAMNISVSSLLVMADDTSVDIGSGLKISDRYTPWISDRAETLTLNLDSNLLQIIVAIASEKNISVNDWVETELYWNIHNLFEEQENAETDISMRNNFF